MIDCFCMILSIFYLILPICIKKTNTSYILAGIVFISVTLNLNSQIIRIISTFLVLTSLFISSILLKKQGK